MSKLEQLIDELCPDGVKYKMLGIVSNIYDGTHSTPKYTPSGVKFVSVQNINSLYESNKFISQEDYDKFKIKPQYGDVFMTRIGDVGTATVVDSDEPIAYYVSLALIRTDKTVNPYYLKYYISSKYFKKELNKRIIHTAVPIKINLGEIGKCYIALPPLPVQEEIVRALDNFTQLTAELNENLTAELTARKQQYEYYRDELLAFGDEVEWKPLSKIGPVCMCKRIMKSETNTQSGVPFYKIGTFGKEPNAFISNETYKKYKRIYKFPKKGDILISAAGTIGRTVVYDGNPAYFQDSNIVWIENDESQVLNSFLIHCYAMKPWFISDGGTISRLYNDNILKAKIPVPPLPEQQRIVEILDRFDALCNDISVGLPAEIKARQQQYEHYRDKLLTFKEKEVCADE